MEDGSSNTSTLNWLRAAVLGANDGIISVASIVVGVAGAIADSRTILISGIAGLLAGAFSMSAGEYVSVSSQRDVERRMNKPEHALVSPIQAALASFGSFVVGGVIPLAVVVATPESLRIQATFVGACVAMALTGVLSAVVSGASIGRTTFRVVAGGLLAMAVTYGIGTLFGVAGI